MKKPRLYTILLFLAVFICGNVVGYFLTIFLMQPPMIPDPVEVRADSYGYNFVNPLLYLKTNKEFYTAEYKDLVASLNSYIASKQKDGSTSTISVYFRDLNSGHWTGVNENDLYEPSSMLKVVTLMATAQIAEQYPGFLSEKISYKPTDQSLQYYKPDENLGAGQYSIQNLDQAMIVDSDNGADLSLLADKQINLQFTKIYNLFRLPSIASSTDFMSAKSYSVIFRTLYNATLLSPEASDQVLQLLTHTNFTDGLVSGIPQGVIVAHKFGERTNVSGDGTVINRELHDCGIVYYPYHPYIICVMTKGQDFKRLAPAISDISKIIYQYVDTTYKKISD